MFKSLNPTTKLFGGLIVFVLFIIIIVISVSGNKAAKQPQVQYVNDNASADNKVEALKTMTSDLLSLENKNKHLQKTVENLQTQNKDAMGTLKKSMASKMQEVLQKIQVQTQQKQQAEVKGYPVNGGSSSSSFIWISDVSKTRQKNASKSSKGLFSINDKDDSNSLLHFGSHQASTIDSSISKKNLVKPAYTIPVNATLTGAILMTPLVGRVPIDGKLPSPYHFKLVLSAKNLTANGYPMPGIKGAVMSGIASGDMLGRCARGDINSITFIFNDGTISTTQSKGNNHSLGYLSSQTGNPCILGSFHSDAALFLGAQMGLAGAQGYANALSNSQYMRSMTPEGSSIQALIGSANKVAIGQSVSAAAEAAQTWWNRRVRNSFDYIYVPNMNPKTGRPMRVVVNISQQIPINHNPKARKVNYENSLQIFDSQLD